MRIINVEQGSDEWLELRKSKVTSTDCAVLMNLSPFKKAFRLWEEKVGVREGSFKNAAMQRGNDCEEDALLLYKETLCLDFEPAVVVSDLHPWLMASLDGLCFSRGMAVEIKTPLEKNYAKLIESIPIYYQIQMQAVFAACDGYVDSMDFVVYSPEQQIIDITPVKPDKEMIKRIVDESKDFHRRLREFDPPPPLHKVVQSDEMRRAVDEYVLACDMQERALKMKNQAAEKIKAISNGESIEGFGVKLTNYWRKGAVDYQAIPELEGVDLEKYRKPGSSLSRITLGAP